jgi:hypothetical protein
MAKTKYCPEVVTLIISTLALTGRDIDGCKAAGINQDTFYSWKKTHAEFSEAVKAAKERWRVSLQPEVVNQAKSSFADYIYGRVPHGRGLGKRSTDGTYPPPRWAIERVLDVGYVEGAINTLIKAGWLPPWYQHLCVTEGKALMRAKFRDLWDLK